MTWADLGEIIKVLAAAATAGAASFAAWFAYKSVSQWRLEALGLRRIELAEEILSKFYEADTLIQGIRSPFAFVGESESRVAPPDETNAEKGQRDTYFAPLARIDSHAKFFSDLQAKRYQMKALFGPEAEEPFKTINMVLHQIATSARMLMSTVGEQPEDVNQLRNMESIIWMHNEDDELATEVKEAVSAMEEICRPVLEKRAA